MTEWTLDRVEPGTMVTAGGAVEAGLSLRFVGEDPLTEWQKLQRWTPQKWVTSYCLLLDRASQSCSLALLIEGQCLSPHSAVRTAADLTARTLKSLLTHCSQYGLSPTELAVEADEDGMKRVQTVLEQFRAR